MIMVYAVSAIKKIQHRLKDEFYNNNFIEVMFHQIRNEIKQHYKQKNVL